MTDQPPAPAAALRRIAFHPPGDDGRQMINDLFIL
jgi:hypothetical protein